MKAIIITLLLANISFLPPESRVVKEAEVKKGAPNLYLVDLMPSDGGEYLYYMTCAPKTSKHKITGQFTARFYLKNNEGKTITLTGITYYFGNSKVKFSKKMMLEKNKPKVKSIKIGAGKIFEWQNSRDYNDLDNAVLFNENLPTSVEIHLTFKGYDEPYVIDRKLKNYTNLTPGGGYRFPARESELGAGEFWSLHGGHAGGGQFFAYDFGTVAWDPKIKKWNNKYPGTDGSKNEHYLAYGKSIIAAADGVVIDFANDVTENIGKDKVGSGGGNFIKINNGKETMCYYHMQKYSLNKAFLKKGAVVKKGDFIGLLGNSGNSGAPHGHIHVIDDPDADGQGVFRPLNFVDAYAIDRSAYTKPLPNAGWVKLVKKGLPYVEGGRMMLWPSAAGPCWYPRGKKEIAKHGLSKSNYQQEVQKIWDCGYYPTWVDAYDVKGKTYFNVVFRPMRAGMDLEVRHGLSSKSFQNEYKNLVEKKNYRLLQVDSYNDEGKLRFAVIFFKPHGAPQSQPAYHAQSAEKHQQLFEKYTDLGYVPVNVSVASVKGKRYYTAFYEKRDVGNCKLRSNLSQEEYQEQFDDMNDKNWEQVYINAYTHGGKTRFSVIWYQKAGYDKGVATRKSDGNSYQEKWDTYTKIGYLTRCVTGYADGKKHNYAALWTK